MEPEFPSEDFLFCSLGGGGGGGRYFLVPCSATGVVRQSFRFWGAFRLAH